MLITVVVIVVHHCCPCYRRLLSLLPRISGPHVFHILLSSGCVRLRDEMGFWMSPWWICWGFILLLCETGIQRNYDVRAEVKLVDDLPILRKLTAYCRHAPNYRSKAGTDSAGTRSAAHEAGDQGMDSRPRAYAPARAWNRLQESSAHGLLRVKRSRTSRVAARLLPDLAWES